jgi:hypothetical protein
MSPAESKDPYPLNDAARTENAFSARNSHHYLSAQVFETLKLPLRALGVDH